MPQSNTAATVFIDVAALRRAGVLDSLAGPRALEEPEYRAFVNATDFDYRKDLDTVLASFQGKNGYFLLRGNFDWKTLRDYALRERGACLNAVCRVPSSNPDRSFSFMQISSRVMALALSTDRFAVRGLAKRHSDARPKVPAEPVWAAMPGQALKSVEGLPAGTKLFAQALENAERVVFTLGPEGARLSASMDVQCRTAEDAVVLKYQLEKVTDILRKLLSRTDQQPNPRDLSGVLTAGSFERQDRRVIGRWPLEKPFLDALTGGNL